MAVRRIRRLPLLMMIGLAAMAVAGALDVVLHLGSSGHAAHDGLASEHLAHLLGIAGMTIVLAGVVLHGVRRQLRQRAARHGGLDRNAHR